MEADVSRIGVIETVLTRKRVRVGVIIFSKLCIAENFVSYSVLLDGLRLPTVVLFALFVLMILPPDNVCPSHTVSRWWNISDWLCILGFQFFVECFQVFFCKFLSATLDNNDDVIQSYRFSVAENLLGLFVECCVMSVKFFFEAIIYNNFSVIIEDLQYLLVLSANGSCPW